MDISMKICVNFVAITSIGTVQSRRELDGSVSFRGREGKAELDWITEKSRLGRVAL